MDLSKLTAVTTTNPQGQNFKLKFNPVKESITFSQKLFDEMQLEYNSLSQFKGDQENMVVIGVCPGNSGVFYKKRTGKKGKTVKSAELTKTLLDAKIKRGKLDLIKIGNLKNIEYYQIVQEGDGGFPEAWDGEDKTDPSEVENVKPKDSFV